jgi:universal stress protein A
MEDKVSSTVKTTRASRTVRRPASRARNTSRPRPSLRTVIVSPVVSEVSLEKILVPIDFSAGSLKALRYAVALAEQFEAKVHLLSVIATAPFLNDLENVAVTLPESEMTEQARRKLVSLAQREINPLVSVRAEIRKGKVIAEIVAASKEANADLIVLATHGYTGVKHVMLGSTAESVVRHAPCPVLVVREQEREFVRTHKSASRKEKP